MSDLTDPVDPRVASDGDQEQVAPGADANAQAVAASDLVAACEAAWAAIQARHPGVPDTVVVLGSGVERGRLVKLGHWWGGQWRVGAEARGEVLLAGEALHLPPEAVFEVLLHEAAHGLSAARGVRDASRGGRYHNAHYKAAAAEVGLRPRRMDPYGWARTDLTPAAAEAYAPVIAGIATHMRLARGLPAVPSAGVEGGAEGRPGLGDGGQNDGASKAKAKAKAAECGCEPSRKLRMAPSVLERGPVICGLCGSEFAMPPQAEARVAASPGTGLDRAPSPARAAVDGSLLARSRTAEVAAPEAAETGHAFDLRTIELPDAAASKLPEASASVWAETGIERLAGPEPPLPGRLGAEVGP